MSGGTLESLIRAHQLNPRTLYQAPETDRVSTPGLYDQTGSQRSPSLDRRTERDAARSLGDALGLDADDLDDIGDYEDLNDLLNDIKVDPPEPPEPPRPPVTEPPPPPPVSEPPITVDPPTVSEGVRGYVLHSGAISYSGNGGATFARYDTPASDPIGFVVTGHGVYVATEDAAFFSANLGDWVELPVPTETIPVEGFENGGFESGLSGWTTVSGYSPRTGYVEHVIPSEGVSYLRRDWIIFTAGEFEIEQKVELSASERAMIEDGAILRVSGDIFTEGSAVGTISLVAGDGLYSISGGAMPAAIQASDSIGSLLITGFDGAPGGAGSLRFKYSYFNNGTPNVEEIRLQVWLTVGEHEYTHAEVVQTEVADAAALIGGGDFNLDWMVDLTSPSGPGSFQLTIPAGWHHPIVAAPNTGGAAESHADVTSAVTVTNDAYELGSASRSGFTFETVAFELSLGGLPGSGTSVAIRVKAEGSPAEVYVDNIRLELLVAGDGVEITAIGANGGSAYVAAAGALYKLSPHGMSRERELPIAAECLDFSGGGLIATAGNDVFIEAEEAVYSLPHAIKKSIGGLLLMKAGEVWQRRSDPEDPGWTTLTPSGVDVIDMAPIDGGWIVLNEYSVPEGGVHYPVRTTRDFTSFSNAPTADVEGDSIAVLGRLVVTYERGDPWFYHIGIGSSAWSYAQFGAGILDISA